MELDDTFGAARPWFWDQPVEKQEACFARLRRERPVARMNVPAEPAIGQGESMCWGLFRHADVAETSRRPGDFCSGQGTNLLDLPPDFLEFFQSLATMDGPRHARLRRVVSRAFTPRRLGEFAPRIRELATQLVEGVAGRDEWDFITEVAARLPLQVILELLGVPPGEEPFVFQQTSVILGFGDPGGILSAATGLRSLFTELAQARRKKPQNDVITALVTGEVDGEHLSARELASFFILLAVAGNETTRNAIAHGLVALDSHPGQRARWMADFPGLAPTAVEEIVRWATPVRYVRRTVTRDGVRLGGHEFAAGEKVALWYCSANRDEAVFPDPYRFDVGRKPNEHVGFGLGSHYCLGAHLARQEITALFGVLFTRLPGLAVAGEPGRRRSSFLNELTHVPVTSRGR